MYCSQCKAEYRDGFTHCSDCDVDLVERLTAPDADSNPAVSETDLRVAWEGQDESECVSICKELKAAGVPFEVNQNRTQYFQGLDEHYKIGVPPDFYDQAKQIINDGGFVSEDDEGDDEDEPTTELPADDESAAAENSDDRPPKKWRSADASVEIWSEETATHGEMIEISLRENEIQARLETRDNGSLKIFVTPYDELRAREIVREIDCDTPPK
jgi:hypothetical protein